MLRVLLTSARPGMTLGLPVFHPRQPATVLLKAGVRLEDRLIGRLRDTGVRELYIQYPRLEFLAEYVSPAIFEAREHVTRHIGDAFDAITGDVAASLDYYQYRAGVVSLLEKLAESPRAALFVGEMADHDQPLLRHSAAVCYLALLMGLKLEPYLVQERARLSPATARDVAPLGVGAMLHDVGMLRLDPEVIRRWEARADENDEAWRAHATIGYDLVKGRIDPSAAVVVLHHHQRYDGSGFPSIRQTMGPPAAPAGSDIHIFARIVAAADRFDRLRAPPARPRLPIVRALRQMVRGEHRAWLDPMVLRALVAVVPPYAPGSRVTLSDGTEGAVTAWHPTNPCRPTVAPLVERRGELVAEVEDAIDLRHREDLRVARMDGETVLDDHFEPELPWEFDLDRALKALTNAAADMPQDPGANAA